MLSTQPDPTPLPPVTHFTNTIFTQGRGSTNEKVKGALSQDRSKTPTLLTEPPVYKIYETPVKTTFRVWCLYSYWVHDTIENSKI
jgi:hypothetical protein